MRVANTIGASTPTFALTDTKQKAPDSANVGGPAITKNSSQILDEQDPASKAFATMRASLALEGYTLMRTDDGDGTVRYFVTRWGNARELPTLGDVCCFLDMIGGAKS